MIISGYTISFISYAIPLLLITGFVLIRIDAGSYSKQGKKKEQKLSLFLGWTNVVLGISMFVVKSIYY